MTEILTESFCERCGTRYTFESARPKTRLKSVKVLSRGLKNFVLSDDTSIDEAMAAARSETDREATAHQLDAFHKTFNFCMSCRQYTCPNCWNEPEARCLSCAPLELPEPPVRLEDLAARGNGGLIGEAELIGESAARKWTPGHVHDGRQEAVEAVVAPGDATEIAAETGLAASRMDIEAATEPGQAVATPPASPDAVPELVAAADVGDGHALEADPTSKATAQTTGLFRRFRPGQSLDAELDAFERARSAAAGTAGDVVEATPPSNEPAEAVTGGAPTEAPAPADTHPPATEPAPEPQPLAAASPADIVEQPTWRITAPDPGAATPLPPTAEPGGSIPLQATAAEPTGPSAEPQWPARPQWPGTTPAAGLPFLGRPAVGQGGIEALWAASNQELVTAAPPPGRATSGGIQPCVSCGLSLSATARFCRRCGALQGR